MYDSYINFYLIPTNVLKYVIFYVKQSVLYCNFIKYTNIQINVYFTRSKFLVT